MKFYVKTSLLFLTIITLGFLTNFIDNELSGNAYNTEELNYPKEEISQKNPYVKIDSPKSIEMFESLEDQRVWPSKEPTLIIGSAVFPKGMSYRLEYQKLYEQNYQLVYESWEPVNNGLLGQISFSESGYYNIRVIIPEDSTIQEEILIYVDTSLHVGWPRSKNNLDNFGQFNNDYGPLVYDIDNDGTLEIISSSYASNKISIMDHVGVSLPGWPVKLEGCNSYYMPAVADLNLDGTMELVVTDSCGSFTILDSEGNIILRKNTQTEDSLFRPTLFDIDGDNYLDIIFITRRGLIQAYSHLGTMIEGYPIQVFDSDYEIGISSAHISIADIDADNEPELFFNMMYNLEWGTPNYLIVYYKLSGTTVTSFGRFRTVKTIRQPDITIADIIPGGDLEIISAIPMPSEFTNPSSLIYVWNSDLDILDGWPVRADLGHSGIAGNPLREGGHYVSLADIDNDGEIEIVLSGYEITNSGNLQSCVQFFNNRGEAIPNKKVCSGNYGGIHGFAGKINLANVDDDDDLEIVSVPVSLRNNYYQLSLTAFNYGDFSVVDGFPKLFGIDIISGWGQNYANYITVADIDADGFNELLYSTLEQYMYVWDTKGISLNNERLYANDIRNTENFNSQCRDGSFVGDCQLPKPLYCGFEQEIVPNCNLCGCPSGKACSSNGACNKLPPIKTKPKQVVSE